MISQNFVERRLFIEASPEIVFSFFTDSQRLLLWTGEAVDIDPKPGGRFRVRFDQRGLVDGTYLDIEPFKRILLTWGWLDDKEVPPGSSKVEITFTEQPTGTLIHLRHFDLARDIKGHEGGWDYCLPRLAEAIAAIASS